MSKKKPKEGHERERFGFRITTEPVGDLWLVRIEQKDRRSMRGEDGKFTSGKPELLPPMEKDGFRYEGEALDWGEDWAAEHRPYAIEMRPYDNGYDGVVVDECGIELYRTSNCETEEEALSVCNAWVAARRRHDLRLIAERRRARANYRMLEQDIRETEQEALAEQEAAKAKLKKVEKDREQLLKDLNDPQVTFNFVAELEKGKVREQRAGKSDRQQDIEERLSGKGARGALLCLKGGGGEEATP